jgi:MFS family permease
MQQIAQSWLVYDLTGSAMLVGLNGLFQALPFIVVSFYAGTVIDRMDRRRLLIWISWANALISLWIAIMISTGHVALWHIYLSGVLHGLVGAFENPARSALLPHLVPRADLMTATSLNSIQRKGAQIIGPALGGLFLAAFGTAGSYYVRAATFALVVGTIAMIRASNPIHERSRQPTIRAIVDGVQYLKGNRVLSGLILMEAGLSVFGSYSAMMVIFAREVFHVGPSEQGLLQGMAGLGSVTGSLVLAGIGDVRHKGRILIVSSLIYCVALLAFSSTPWFGLAVPLLAIVGGMDLVHSAIRQTIVQLVTRDAMLGRVMSLMGISQRGFGPLGGFQAGLLTSALGSVQLATALGAILSLAIVLGVAVRVPALRSYQENAGAEDDLALSGRSTASAR